MKTTQRLYFNADKSKLVPQDDPAAVSLAYGAGDELAKGDEKKLPPTKAKSESQPQPPRV